MKYIFRFVGSLIGTIVYSLYIVLKFIWLCRLFTMKPYKLYLDDLNFVFTFGERMKYINDKVDYSTSYQQYPTYLDYLWGGKSMNTVINYKTSEEELDRPSSNSTKENVSIIKSMEREYGLMEPRNWDRIFMFFDLHGTVIKPNRIVGNTDIEYYPYAKETLQILSKQSDVDLNIYTCSHEHEIIEYQKKFKADGINFKYVNENPDVETGGYGNYDIKPYMNVLFEDKAGFFGETDWEPVYEFVKNRYLNDS